MCSFLPLQCFISYIKGYFLMKNKDMFDISKIDTTKYAQSLGLVLIPRIRFLQKHEKMMREKEEKLKGMLKDYWPIGIVRLSAKSW